MGPTIAKGTPEPDDVGLGVCLLRGTKVAVFRSDTATRLLVRIPTGG
jgi:hypothetical protein